MQQELVRLARNWPVSWRLKLRRLEKDEFPITRPVRRNRLSATQQGRIPLSVTAGPPRMARARPILRRRVVVVIYLGGRAGLFLRGDMRSLSVNCSVSESSCAWSKVIRLSWTSCSCRISIRRASMRERRLATGCTTATTMGGTLRRRSVFAFDIPNTLPPDGGPDIDRAHSGVVRHHLKTSSRSSCLMSRRLDHPGSRSPPSRGRHPSCHRAARPGRLAS
jgi:hypothetical protein